MRIRGLFDPGSEDGKIRIRDKYLGSGMNIPDHISESLETIFSSKILKFIDADPDPESGIFEHWIRDGKIRIRNTAYANISRKKNILRTRTGTHTKNRREGMTYIEGPISLLIAVGLPEK